MTLKTQLDEAGDILSWLGKSLDGTDLPADDRTRMAATLFHLVHEVFEAMLVLARADSFGAAFMLLRPSHEILVRAIWLKYAATPDQMAAFQNETVPGMPQLLNATKASPFGDHVRAIHDKAWTAMCSYTHGGMRHITRRINGQYIEPNYGEDGMAEVLRLGRDSAMLAAIEVADMAKKEDFIAEALKRFEAWYPAAAGEGANPA